MDLKFVAQKKPAVISASVQRRQRLARRIDQQLELLRSPAAGTSPRAMWAWMDDGGAYFLPIKYGRQQLELKKGMFAIQCKDLPECGEALKTVREMVMSGNFDEQLAKVSVDIRQRFSA